MFCLNSSSLRKHQEEFIPLTAGNVRQPQTNANNNPKSKRKPSKPSSQSAAQKPQQQQQKKRKREDDGAKAEESNETAAAQTGGDTVQQDKSRKKRKPSKGPQNGDNKQEQAKDAKKETMDIVQEADEDKVEEQSSKKKPKQQQTTISQRTYSAFIGECCNHFQAKNTFYSVFSSYPWSSSQDNCLSRLRKVTSGTIFAPLEKVKSAVHPLCLSQLARHMFLSISYQTKAYY